MVIKKILKVVRRGVKQVFRRLDRNSIECQQEKLGLRKGQNKIDKFQLASLFDGWRSFITKKVAARFRVQTWIKDAQCMKLSTAFSTLKKFKTQNDIFGFTDEIHRLRLKFESTQENHANILDSLQCNAQDFHFFRLKRIQSVLEIIFRKTGDKETESLRANFHRLAVHKRRIQNIRLALLTFHRFTATRLSSGFREIWVFNQSLKEASTLHILRSNKLLKDSLNLERESLNDQLLSFQTSKTLLHSVKNHYLKTTKRSLQNFLTTKLYHKITTTSQTNLLKNLFQLWRSTHLKKAALLNLTLLNLPHSTLKHHIRLWRSNTLTRLQSTTSAKAINTIFIKYEFLTKKSTFQSIQISHKINTKIAIITQTNFVYQKLYTNLKKNFSVRFEVLYHAVAKVTRRLKSVGYREIGSMAGFRRLSLCGLGRVERLYRKRWLWRVVMGWKGVGERGREGREGRGRE
jgi:hypothetical protein